MKKAFVWAFSVFSWGLGMFWLSTISQYWEWRVLGNRFGYPILTRIVVGLLIWPTTGWLIGVFTAPDAGPADL